MKFTYSQNVNNKYLVGFGTGSGYMKPEFRGGGAAPSPTLVQAAYVKVRLWFYDREGFLSVFISTQFNLASLFSWLKHKDNKIYVQNHLLSKETFDS